MRADMRRNGKIVASLLDRYGGIRGEYTDRSHVLSQNLPSSKNSLATDWHKWSRMNLYGNLERAIAGQKEPDGFTLGVCGGLGFSVGGVSSLSMSLLSSWPMATVSFALTAMVSSWSTATVSS